MTNNVPVHERVGENPSIVGIRRSGHTHVPPEGVRPQDRRERSRPAERVHDRIVINLVEVVTSVVVCILDEGAHHVRRRILS